MLCCTGAKIADEQTWRDRVAQVRASGTASLVTASAQRAASSAAQTRATGKQLQALSSQLQEVVARFQA